MSVIMPSFVIVNPEWKLPDTWPDEHFIDNSDIGFEPNRNTAWRLDMCADATISLRKRGEKPFNGAALPVYWHDNREELENVQHIMCRLGYPGTEDPRLTHEGGKRWFFSWIPRTYTLWQIEAAQRIIHMFLSPDFTRQQVQDECQRLTVRVADAAEEMERKVRAGE